MKLSKNATLRDVRALLANPEDFVRKAFGVIRTAWKEDNGVTLRLGITGTGQFPNYRIESSGGIPILALDGANHQPWPDGEQFDGVGTWSSTTMSKNEVEELLGEIRNFPKKSRC